VWEKLTSQSGYCVGLCVAPGWRFSLGWVSTYAEWPAGLCAGPHSGSINDLKTRGVNDILIAVTDGLKGMPEALQVVFPATTLQTSSCT
jgi:Transposase, Mutator family